ncbi:MAG: amino acid ABC transporter substrate-binding protein [Anaerolineae bacterium]
MLKKVAVFCVLMALLVGVFSIATAQDQPVTVGPITQRVLDRGEVICGANKGGLAGFAVVNSAGEWQGFDVDFCRAVAAAVLGDASKVTFRPLEAAERQAAIQSEEVDMMSRNTTWTLSRDAVWGATFAPTTFYDGQGMMVKSDSGITDLAGLEGLTICVQSGTTTELNLADQMSLAGVGYTPKVFNDANATWDAFVQGQCDAFTTDKSGLISYKGSAPDPSAFSILDVTMSKEPLGPLSPASDPQWADIIRWVVFGTIQAEEFGITSQNVDDFVGSDVPEIQRFLGQGDNAIGSLYGIANDFMIPVIKQVGNYGEIFDRNLGPDTPFNLGRGVNDLWTRGGLLYSPPFR